MPVASRLLPGWAGALALLAACASGPVTPAPVLRGTVALEPCHLGTPGLSTRVAAECGTFTVPENRAAPSGRQIELRLAVLPAISRDPAADPLFFITGGPGQAASESFVVVAPAFAEINRERDIVLVDQRGTGQSHPLRCPAAAAEPDPGRYSPEQEVADTAACQAGLDADLTQYTTANAVDDLDAVRAALGYERVNLYGVSYGTRVALDYLRRYPERVRSAILDGVVPADWTLGPSLAADAQRAIDLIFDRCAADPGCRAAFPELRAEFEALAGRLANGPVNLTVRHPVTGAETPVTYTHALFAQSVRLLSYSAETVALLPLLIHTAQAQGDLRPLAAQSLLVLESFDESISDGMQLSVLCAEDTPFYTPDQARQASAGTYLGAAPAEQLLAVCAEWPRAEVRADLKTPVSADAPVLLLSGEADPVTPPANGEQAARSLPNSRHLVVPGQGHNVIVRGCLPQVGADFVARGSADGLAVECVSAVQALPFFVSFAGPEP